MSDQVKINRRDFLKISAGAGAGLIIGINFTACGNDQSAGAGKSSADTFSPNAWLSISPDNTVTIKIAEVDMGQGVMTALPMLIAEELDAAWSTIKVKAAPLDPIYGFQVTGGSDTIRNAWETLRNAGAVAREMLREAASKTWEVPINECIADQGNIVHTPSGKKLSYGKLTETASDLSIPDSVKLKTPDQFKLLGHPMPRLDSLDKIKGTAVYGTDVRLPGLLTATIKQCPVFGGKLKSVDPSKAEKIIGVKKVVTLDSAVAVVADNFWSAQKALNALDIVWDKDEHQSISSQSIRELLRQQVPKNKDILQNDGDVNSVFNASSKIIESEYELPFQAHATMEPMNCTAHVHDGKCDIWVSTQTPSGAQITAFNETFSGISKTIEKLKRRLSGGRLESVHVNTTVIGGGFGRRFKNDYVAQAVQISKSVKAPVKLIWSREEDIRHDFYRPMNIHRMRAVLDKDGLPLSWSHQAAGTKIRAGGAVNLPYQIKNVFVALTETQTGIPVGSWRSVDHSYNAFVTESFIDELANTAGQDPIKYRLKLLKKESRLAKVLKLVAEKSGWYSQAAEGHYRGVAAHFAFGSYIAQVAEISITESNEIKIHRVVCAFDCGLMVNPDTIRAQLEGGILFGLTATVKSGITIKDGQVEQSNFHDFPLIRLNETPEINIHLVHSAHSPGGVGEPPVPPIAPAIANAIYAATKNRVRSLPIGKLIFV